MRLDQNTERTGLPQGTFPPRIENNPIFETFSPVEGTLFVRGKGGGVGRIDGDLFVAHPAQVDAILDAVENGGIYLPSYVLVIDDGISLIQHRVERGTRLGVRVIPLDPNKNDFGDPKFIKEWGPLRENPKDLMETMRRRVLAVRT
ncbi:MAG: hypothetical protein WC777_05080 [Candidatus Gracilibacteria bacterium]|jgi:hypothetical protein